MKARHPPRVHDESLRDMLVRQHVPDPLDRSTETIEWETARRTLAKVRSQRSHPFYTGKQILVDSGGRVERFRRRYAKVGVDTDLGKGPDADDRARHEASVGGLSEPPTGRLRRRPGRPRGRHDAGPGSAGPSRSAVPTASSRPSATSCPGCATAPGSAAIPFLRGDRCSSKSLSLGFRALSWSAQKAGDEDEEISRAPGHRDDDRRRSSSPWCSSSAPRRSPPTSSSDSSTTRRSPSSCLDGVIRIALIVGYIWAISRPRRSSGSSSITVPSTRRSTPTRTAIRSTIGADPAVQPAPSPLRDVVPHHRGHGRLLRVPRRSPRCRSCGRSSAGSC